MRHHLTGSKFRTAKTTFKVVEAETYPATKVSRRYKGILAFKPGFLVAVGFRGTCIPNITGGNGVVRLTKIEVDGEIFDRPSTISEVLGVERPMTPYQLRQL